MTAVAIACLHMLIYVGLGIVNLVPLPIVCSEVDFFMFSGDCLAPLAPATSLIELRVLVNHVLDWGPVAFISCNCNIFS